MSKDVSLDIGPNITELLEKVATSLGATVGELYPLLTQRVYIEAVVQLVAFLVAIACLLVICCIAVRMPYKDSNWDNDIVSGIGIASGVLLVIVTTACLASIASTIGRVSHPEAYVITDLATSFIKK